MDVILLIAGLALLIKGADIFVDGASSIASRLRVPPLIIGLTVVSFGTSAPEAAISISASISGSNLISLGNVIGSNIFNLLMVIGVTALAVRLSADRDALRRDMPLCLFSSGIIAVMMLDGVVGRLEALLLLAVLAVYIAVLILSARRKPAQREEEKQYSLALSIFFIAGGAASVVLGGDLAVEKARSIASAFGMSETLIGLTVVALGTSLPELVTSLTAARKGETGIAIGNAVGSCLFNNLFILGLTGFIKPIEAERGLIADACAVAAAALTVYIFAAKGKGIGRSKGIVLVLFYAVYTAFIILRA